MSGTFYNAGSVSGSLDVSGASLLAEGGSIAGEITVGAHGLIDFARTLTAGGTLAAGQAALSLAAGGLVIGGGTLIAGDAGLITGAGTILAGGGDTLLVGAGSISGTALQAAGGGVLELGIPGLFTTPLTIASTSSLGFASGYGAAPITGSYADSLAQDGGVIVIEDPLTLKGSITGFAPGDRLVFPGLTGLSLSSVTSQSFIVTGRNSGGQQESFTINAATPSGAVLETGLDAQGDAEISLRDTQIDMFVGGASFSATSIDASAGVGQALPGLEILLQSWTTQSLTLTLSVAHGSLSDGTLGPAAQLVLNAANPAALNSLLSGVVYTANFSVSSDTLIASGNTGLLAGLSASVPIVIAAGGTVSGFASSPTAEQTVLFTASSGPVTKAAAPGEVIVSGNVDFADVLQAGGIGGTALVVDGGAVAAFDAGAEASLAADVVLGDAGGAGTLGIMTDDFSIGGNLLVGGTAAGDAEISGAAAVAGNVVVAAGGRLDLSGSLTAATATIGSGGSFSANGGTAGFGALLDSGSLILRDNAEASASQLVLAGRMTLSGGATLAGLGSAVIAAGGSLVVGAGALLASGGLNEVGGSVLDAGLLEISGNVVAAAPIALAGTLEAAAATFASGATLSGAGTLAASRIAVSGGEILASGGVLTLDGNVTASGAIVVAGSAGLDLLAGGSGGITFAGADAVLTLGDIAAESASVSGMVASDVIDIVGIAPGQVSSSGGTITALNGSGGVAGRFALTTAAGQPAITIASDNAGGALITLGGEMACFVRGTRLLTPNGYVPVEQFKPGDPIITRHGIRRAVRWIGRRNLEIGLKARQEARPVVIAPGAFGPGLPSRPVRLSPSHAVFADGVLVPVMHLVNGATILREQRPGKVSYFHLELDRHDVLVAEGLPVESYIDTGNRGEFHQEAGIRGQSRQACAPLVTCGPKLARIRRRLHGLALQAGFTLARAPVLHALAADRLLQPDFPAPEKIRFMLPEPAERLLLLAESAVPAETDPDSEDRRELAICLRQLRAKRQRLNLGAGWHPVAQGDRGVWMSGSGEILLPAGTREVTLSLAAVAQSWLPPGLTPGLSARPAKAEFPAF